MHKLARSQGKTANRLKLVRLLLSSDFILLLL
jgi:hypothetical protein